MNRALDRSTGQFIWFLNGGDTSTLTQWAPLATALRRSGPAVVLADYILQTGNRELVRRSRKPSYIWHGLPTSHQAIFYPGDVTRAEKYDLTYRIVGDYAMTARLMVGKQAVRSVSMVVAAFQSGGLSQQQSERIAVEARRVQREILGTGALLQGASRARHAASRLLRRMQTAKSMF
jgi:putative colanic acid biosynthesis glycosyltransferase